jgi:hypothetical protein
MMKLVATTVLLTMLGSHLAAAQDSTRNAPPPAVKRAQQPQGTPTAPIGHRQPRAGDVPSETGANDPSKIDAQDRELDRMIKGICKGC